MIVLLDPFLIYLELWYVFFPLCAILMITGVVALPTDKVGDSRDPSDVTPGGLMLSLMANFLLFFIIVVRLKLHAQDWILYAILGASYIVFGTVWSLYKWRRLVIDTRETVLSKILSWCDRDHGSWANIRTNGGREDTRVRFYSWLTNDSGIRTYSRLPKMVVTGVREVENKNRNGFNSATVQEDVYAPLTWESARVCLTPVVSKHKGQIMTWLLCWPMSVIKWLLADMVRDFVNFMYSLIQGQFQNLANRQFKDL